MRRMSAEKRNELARATYHHMQPRKIQFYSFPASKPTNQAALLFIHGAYVKASCWEINFIPFFQSRGFDCYSFDLSGHGNSEGRQQIDSFGIADYVNDLELIVGKIEQEVILVGHSMGARVVERFLENQQVAGAILLAPVPTTGTLGSAVQLSQRFPNFIDAIKYVTHHSEVTPELAEMLTKIYFSPSVTPAEALRFFPMVGPESQLAITEMAIPDMRFRVRRPRLPVLVMGGTEDAVFPASMLHFVASPWHATVIRAPGAGHMLMLDHEWSVAAELIDSWLGKHFSSNNENDR